MAITIISAIDSLKAALRDRGGSFLNDQEYEAVLLQTAKTEATYPARRITAGYWVVPMAPLCLFKPAFTEEPGASYELSCGGFGISGAVSIRLTAGVDARDSIDVTGCRVNFAAAMEQLLMHLADHRALDIAQSAHGASKTPAEARAELIRQAEIYRGVVAV